MKRYISTFWLATEGFAIILYVMFAIVLGYARTFSFLENLWLIYAICFIAIPLVWCLSHFDTENWLLKKYTAGKICVITAVLIFLTLLPIYFIAVSSTETIISDKPCSAERYEKAGLVAMLFLHIFIVSYGGNIVFTREKELTIPEKEVREKE